MGRVRQVKASRDQVRQLNSITLSKAPECVGLRKESVYNPTAEAWNTLAERFKSSDLRNNKTHTQTKYI